MHKRLIGELAAFLDSPEGARLGLPRAQGRALCQTVFECVLERVGTMPWEMQPEEMTLLLEEELPRHFGRRDPLAAQVPALWEAYLDYAEGQHVSTQGFELRAALEGSRAAFLAAVERGSGDPRATPPVAPLASRGEKVRRNDPCPCGSGRKFKKCCGA